MQPQHKATDLSPEDRAVVERLLGRQLKDNEVVLVNAEDEELALRKEAHQALLASMRETQARFTDIPEDELNALIDEACDYVRHNPE